MVPVKADNAETFSSLRAAFDLGIRNLHPAYFALVMATGIVAIAAQLEGMVFLAKALTWLNCIAFILLWLLTLARLAAYPRPFWEDLIDHNRGVGFFTSVAGTGVLGCELIVVYGEYRAAFALWFLAGVLWILLTYAIFTAFTVKGRKPSLAEGINGGWLIAVVGTQAVSGLASLLAPQAGGYETGIFFLALCFWLNGGMLYIWMISPIFYRYTFFTFDPSDLMPPYWINRGAVAISTLAGTLLIVNAPAAPFLEGSLQYCSLYDSDTFGEFNSHVAAGPSGAQWEIAHLPLDSPRAPLAPARDNPLLQDLLQHSLSEHFSLLRGE